MVHKTFFKNFFEANRCISIYAWFTVLIVHFSVFEVFIKIGDYDSAAELFSVVSSSKANLGFVPDSDDAHFSKSVMKALALFLMKEGLIFQ